MEEINRIAFQPRSYKFLFKILKKKMLINSWYFQIKFLKTKEGAAMIQMGDASAVERCVQHLNNAPIFNSKNRLQLGYSKQLFLSDVTNPFTLPDGSPSFKDFIGNKHNRFVNLAMSLKNRIQSPSRVRFSDFIYHPYSS